MNKLKELKTKFVNKISRFFRFGSDADRDWKLVLSICFFLVSIFIIIDLFDFFRFTNFETGTIDTKADFEFIDKKALKDILDIYNERALNFEKIQLGQDIR